MTQDEIIRMAREAGLLSEDEAWVSPHQEAMERFAALAFAAGAAHEREKEIKRVAEGHGWTQAHWTAYEESIAAAEREACAKVCEGRADSYKYATDPWAHEHISEANTCAAAIRARGDNK